MQQKKLILSIIALFVVSSACLLAIGSKYGTPDFGTDWWALYFENPKSDNVSFIIENYASSSYFQYEVLAGKTKIADGSVEIKKGEKKEVTFPDDFASKSFSASTDLSDKKTTIVVSSADGKKEIYKNLSN